MDKDDLILKLLEEMRSEMNRRFDENNKRIDEVKDEMKNTQEEIKNIRGEMKGLRGEIKDDLREVKQDLRLDSRKLEQVYEAREKVKITFGWQWGMASLFIAVIAVGISKIFT